MRIDGWLVDEHVCVQKTVPRQRVARVAVSMGGMISRDFFSKDDAIDYAKQVRALGID